MEKENDILTSIGRRSGMTVPEGYFEDFARKMAASLPDEEVKPTQKKRSAWQIVRPYVYMAAMFAGVWCMINMFGLVKAGQNDLSIDNNPILAKALDNDAFMEEYIPVESMDDYDVLQEMYDSGVSTDEIFDSTAIEADSSDNF